MALTDQTTDKESMILCGGAFGIFATISAMCNRSADRGGPKQNKFPTLPLSAWLAMVCAAGRDLS